MAEVGEQQESTYDQVDYEEAGLDENNHIHDGENQHEERKDEIPGDVPPGVIPHVLFLSRFRQSSTTEESIRKLLEPYGVVKNIVHKMTVAFCEFDKPEEAYAAKHALHKKPGLGSDSLIVDFKKANTGVQNFNSEGNYLKKDDDHRVRRDDRRSRFEHGDDRRRDDRGDDRNRDYHRHEGRDHRGNHGDFNRRDMPHREGPHRDLPSRDGPHREGPPRDVPPRDQHYDDRSRDDRYYNKSVPVDNYHRPGRGPPEPAPVPYPPQVGGYGRPPMEDRRMPVGGYDHPPMYRDGGRNEPRSRSPYGGPPAYDDRRHKRPYENPPVNDYPPRGGHGHGHGIPPPMRGAPIDGREYYAHHAPYDAPGHVPPPMPAGNPRSRGIEQSTYAANANRPRDFDDRGMSRAIPPNNAVPPVRYEEHMQGRPREYPAPPRGNDYPRGNYNNERPEFRGPPSEDYLSKRPRY